MFAAFTSAGCVSGFIYTNVTEPLSTDMDKTPRGEKTFSIDTKELKEPFTGFGLSAEWDSRAIGDAARRGGMEIVFFADLQTISILNGLWKQQIVRVRGK